MLDEAMRALFQQCVNIIVKWNHYVDERKMEFLIVECHQRQVGIEELYAPRCHPSYGDNWSIEEFSLRHGILEKVKICLIYYRATGFNCT